MSGDVASNSVGLGAGWRDWRIMGVRIGLLVAAGLLAANAIKLIDLSWFAVRYPYTLDYGEGIVWQQMINIAAGRGYAPLGVFPAIVYHYPPVYHLVVSALAGAVGGDGLATGRAVSLGSTLLSIGLVGRLAFAAIPADEPRRVRLLAAIVAAGCAASVPTIVSWAGYMRVDMLAGALSLGGLALTLRSADRSARIALASLCFVLAIYTKQTSIAAPAAAFVALWLARPRAAWTLFALCAGLGLCALAGLSITTHGGFLRHVVLYNLNRVDLSRSLLLPSAIGPQIAAVAIAVLAAGATWRRLQPTHITALRRRLASEQDAFAAFLMLTFLLVRTALLPTILKSGASDNYLIEWWYALAVFVGIGVVPVIGMALAGTPSPRLLLMVMAVIGLPLQGYISLLSASDRDGLVMQEPMRAAIVARIARSARPVISDDMALLIRAGRPVLWEPAITAELSHAGLYDEAAFVNLVRQRRFGFFVTAGDRGDWLYDERYNPPTADAIDAAYPRRERHGDLVLHFPRGG